MQAGRTDEFFSVIVTVAQLLQFIFEVVYLFAAANKGEVAVIQS